MDPITIALSAAALAVGAGAIKGVNEVSRKAVVDSYQGLKCLLKDKLGPDSDVVEAVNKLDEQPDREDRRLTLAKELEIAAVVDDPELLKTAEELSKLMKTDQDLAIAVNQMASGNNIAQAAHNSSATVNIGPSDE